MAVVVARLPSRRDGSFEERDADPGVHDHDERQRSKVDVCKQDRGVDLPHLLVGPVLSAPVEGGGLVVVAQQHSDGLLFGHLQHHPRGTHDGHSQNPDNDYNQGGGGYGQLLLEWVDDASESVKCSKIGPVRNMHVETWLLRNILYVHLNDIQEHLV